MDVASLVTTARMRSGRSKRSLARKAHTSAAALVEYERGRRSPTVDTLERILRAAGMQADVRLRPIVLDPVIAAQRLGQVLELADALPRRAPDPELRYPRLPSP